MNRELENWQKRMPMPEGYVRNIDRQLWRQLWRGACEILCCVATLALAVVVFWLYLIATPDQMSAECEALRAEMEAQGE